jgi:ferrous iron transport protein A
MALLLADALKPSLSISSQPAEMSHPSVHPVLPLCQLPAGSFGRVRELTGGADFCQRVREMGFGESTFVRKIGGSGPFICQVNGTRLALSHGAAMHIIVEPLGGR